MRKYLHEHSENMLVQNKTNKIAILMEICEDWNFTDIMEVYTLGSLPFSNFPI